MNKVSVVRAGLVLALLFLAAGVTHAGPICFTGIDTGGESVGACINVTSLTATTLTFTLSNTTTNIVDIGQTLTGVQFTLSGTTGVTALALSGGTLEDCTSSPCVAGSGTSPYRWGDTLSSSVLTFQAGIGSLGTCPNGTVGQFHPCEIVNSTMITNCLVSCPDGLSNGPHNDVILGPETFTVTGTFNSASSITGVKFYFGTGGDTLSSPEPGTLILFGSGLLGIAGIVRRRLSI